MVIRLNMSSQVAFVTIKFAWTSFAHKFLRLQFSHVRIDNFLVLICNGDLLALISTSGLNVSISTADFDMLPARIPQFEDFAAPGTRKSG